MNLGPIGCAHGIAGYFHCDLCEYVSCMRCAKAIAPPGTLTLDGKDILLKPIGSKLCEGCTAVMRMTYRE